MMRCINSDGTGQMSITILHDYITSIMHESISPEVLNHNDSLSITILYSGLNCKVARDFGRFWSPNKCPNLAF